MSVEPSTVPVDHLGDAARLYRTGDFDRAIQEYHNCSKKGRTFPMPTLA